MNEAGEPKLTEGLEPDTSGRVSFSSHPETAAPDAFFRQSSLRGQRRTEPVTNVTFGLTPEG